MKSQNTPNISETKKDILAVVIIMLLFALIFVMMSMLPMVVSVFIGTTTGILFVIALGFIAYYAYKAVRSRL